MSEFINAEKAKNIDLTEYHNRTGSITLDGLTVGITVTDARVRFGHLDLLVTPTAGSGQKWIESRRITLN